MLVKAAVCLLSRFLCVPSRPLNLGLGECEDLGGPYSDVPVALFWKSIDLKDEDVPLLPIEHLQWSEAELLLNHEVIPEHSAMVCFDISPRARFKTISSHWGFSKRAGKEVRGMNACMVVGESGRERVHSEALLCP